MDERVEIIELIAEGICLGRGQGWEGSSGGRREEFIDQANSVVSVLEAAEYTVAKLEQVGWEHHDGHDLGGVLALGEKDECDWIFDVPVYRIVEDDQ